MSVETQGLLASDWNVVIPLYQEDFNLVLESDHGVTERSYLVPGGQGGWFYFQGMISRFLGYPYMSTIGGATVMLRHLPETVEFLTNDDEVGYMFARSAKVGPFAGKGFIDYDMESISKQIYREWDFVKLTVTFATETYNVWSYDFISSIFNTSYWFPVTEPIPLYTGASSPIFTSFTPELFRYVDWADENKNEFGVVDNAQWVTTNPTTMAQTDTGNKLGLPIPSGEVSLTWFDVHPLAFDPLNARAIQGTTNGFWFYDYPPGTLIFNGFRRRWRRNSLGQKVINVEMRFLLRPYGVNKVVSRDGTGYLQVTKKGTEPGSTSGSTKEINPIVATDFNTLFQAPQAGSSVANLAPLYSD